MIDSSTTDHAESAGDVPLVAAFVVPTLDEENVLPQLLHSFDRVRAATPRLFAAARVFVVDGGSRDATRSIAQRYGAEVVLAEPGRGAQIEAGVEAAWRFGANVAIIAHADTVVPADLLVHLEPAFHQGAVGGGTLLCFEPARGLLRWAAPLVNWRTRRFKVPLGDQLQWVTRDAWQQIGGIEAWPILEDLDLILRLRKVGDLAILPCRATTNARRFVQRGPVRTVLTNWLIWLLYAVGVSPQRLSSLYRHVR